MREKPAMLNFQQLNQLLTGDILASQCKVVAVSGAQGSGKTMLAALLAQAIMEQGRTAAVVSLDDYYVGRAGRQQLARDIHPLLATRGVPGTHQIERLRADLLPQHAGQWLALPSFCKASDDSRPDRPLIRPDVLILEGWCIGLLPLTESELLAQPNSLEQQADADAGWRYWVNQQLSGTYQQVWTQCDALYLLQAPDWQQICRWRAQAEQKLWAQYGNGMPAAALARFMQHYQRWTMQMLAGRHTPVTASFYLNATHQIYHRC